MRNSRVCAVLLVRVSLIYNRTFFSWTVVVGTVMAIACASCNVVEATIIDAGDPAGSADTHPSGEDADSASSSTDAATDGAPDANAMVDVNDATDATVTSDASDVGVGDAADATVEAGDDGPPPDARFDGAPPDGYFDGPPPDVREDGPPSDARDDGPLADGNEGGPAGEGGATATFTSIYTQIIQPNCANCHTAGHSSNLAMSTQSSTYANLVNVTAQGSSCGTSGLKRVVPSNANSSLLYQMITATQSCGGQMPPSYSLPSFGITMVRDWINQGALNN